MITKNKTEMRDLSEVLLSVEALEASVASLQSTLKGKGIAFEQMSQPKHKNDILQEEELLIEYKAKLEKLTAAAPAPALSAQSTRGNLAAQLASISDAGERTKFYRENREALVVEQVKARYPNAVLSRK
jgi:hypothetical protein